MKINLDYMTVPLVVREAIDKFFPHVTVAYWESDYGDKFVLIDGNIEDDQEWGNFVNMYGEIREQISAHTHIVLTRLR